MAAIGEHDISVISIHDFPKNDAYAFLTQKNKDPNFMLKIIQFKKGSASKYSEVVVAIPNQGYV